MKLTDKVAIVTGAATRIGRECAFHLAREGAAVAVQCDVSQEFDVQKRVAETVKAFGRLDILVNNAGIEHEMPFLETPLNLWNEVIAVNLTGPWLCSQAAAKQMAAQGEGGRIINISSVYEDLPMPTKPDPRKFQTLLGEIPLARMGKPEEVAGLVVFLASEAAVYVTGSTYFIDSGMMRQSGSL